MTWFRRKLAARKRCVCGHNQGEHTYLGKYCSGPGGPLGWCMCWQFTEPTPTTEAAWASKVRADRAAALDVLGADGRDETPDDARNEQNLALAAKLDRYEAVIDAARAWANAQPDRVREYHALIDAVRALDGEAGQ